MSRNEPLGGDSSDALPAHEGNRPAQNARLATPGMLSIPGPAGSEGAADFLGLDAEVSGGMGAGELMADAAPQVEEPQETQPEPSAWVESRSVPESAEHADFEDEELAPGETSDDAAGYDDGEVEEAASPHGSWSESAPARGGSRKLVGAAAGVLVLGLLGFGALQYFGAANEEPTPTGPVASRTPPRTERAAGLSAPVALEDTAEPERTLPEDAGALVESVDATPALDPEQAREAFEAQRGDQPPAWFDPALDSQGEAVETGWTPEAEAVTRASTFIGDPVALMVADAAADSAPVEVAATSVAQAIEVAPVETPAQEPVEAAPVVVAAASVAVVAPDPQVEASPAPVAVDSGDVGPALPSTSAAGESAPASESALAAFHESRQSRTSTLKVEDVLLAPTMDGGNLRQAEAKDLSGVWTETSVPMQAIGNKTKVLTPNVGRVRVVLTSKDIFEGRLYAVGQGSVWLESQYGRISVDGKRIASVANIDTKDGTPALGSTGSQNLAGLEKVLVKTPGGSFYGKVIARDDKQTTVITEKGDRLTMDNANVEILTDAPKVTIGGRVDEAPKKP